MDFKIATVLFLTTIFSLQVNAKAEYTSEQYIKNYALSVCVAKGYNNKQVKDDAAAAARGYLEFGDYSLTAHSAVRKLADEFLAKNNNSQSGESMVLTKCIDFYHSTELDKLVRFWDGKQDS